MLSRLSSLARLQPIGEEYEEPYRPNGGERITVGGEVVQVSRSFLLKSRDYRKQQPQTHF
jgi:hypothetical protein